MELSRGLEMIIIDKKYFGVAIDRYDASYMLGVSLFLNRHFSDLPFHLDIIIDLFKWYIEIRIGREE